MRKFSLLFCFIFAGFSLLAQTRLQVVADTVRVVNSEFVVRNASKDIQGYLYNNGNGITRFKKLDLGKSIQFSVGGSSVFPQNADTAYINNDLINRNVKVWRNGLFQYRSRTQGVWVDSTLGKVVFYPSLQEGEKIYIEGLTDVSLLLEMAQAGSNVEPNISELRSGIFVSGNNFILRWASNATTLTSSPRVIGIGSSTLAGLGLSAPNRLGDKIGAWLNANTTTPFWANLAISGNSSANLLPASEGGVPGNNIDAALGNNPDFIFVSLPSNDPAAGINVQQSMVNLRKIDALAQVQGVPVFFETTQPRTSYTEASQLMLKQLADSIRIVWPSRYVEGFLNLVDNSASTSAALLPQYAQSDGIHLTSEGNQLIANELFARWQSFFQPIVGVQQFIIESSSDGLAWSTYDVVTNQNLVKKQFTRSGNNAAYFRVKAVFNNGGSTPYSNVSVLPSTSGGGGGNPGGSGMRVLVDIGGDGSTTVNGSNFRDGKLAPSPDPFGHHWNNWTGTSNLGFINGSKVYNLVTTNNQVTPLSLSLIGTPFGTFYGTTVTRGINFNGFNNSVGEYPMESVYDNMYFHSSANSTGNTIRIKNMQPSAVYSIKLWGARIDTATASRTLQTKLSTESWSGKTFETRYFVGDTANYNGGYTYTGITGVDSLDVNVRVAPGSSFGHLSLIDISITGYQDGTFPTALYPDTIVSLPQSSVQLTGVLNTLGQTVSSYVWEQLSGPTTTTFTNGATAQPTVNGLTNGVYKYRVYITLSNNLLVVDEVVVTVMPDNGNLKTMRVHFSNTPAPKVPGWVNAAGPVTGNFIQIVDPVTGWGLNNGGTSTAYWNPLGGTNGADNMGQGTGNNSGVVPDIVLKNYWYNASKKYSAALAGGVNSNVVLVGLDPSKTYTLKLVGSRENSSAQPRYSSWRINGGSELLQNAWGNTTLQTVVNGVVPDAGGSIRIAVYSPDDTTTGGAYSYLNALTVQEEQ